MVKLAQLPGAIVQTCCGAAWNLRGWLLLPGQTERMYAAPGFAGIFVLRTL
jgi:hypothetical protein